MSQKVADVMWEMLANAGVKRCYGIVGCSSSTKTCKPFPA
jgi:thiamine pyrophosphate-dependent acetolactate synthase large subunit-like protein